MAMTDPRTDLRDDELVPMRHTDPDHGGWTQIPAAAVPAFEARGWEVAPADEQPAEPNAATAELAAYQAQQQAAEAEKPARPARKAAAKSTASAASGDEEKE